LELSSKKWLYICAPIHALLPLASSIAHVGIETGSTTTN
jgi:hypothetical protein